MQNDPLWYRDAVVYQTHVKAFQDSNGDGIGDVAGLTARLDYLAELGVTALWLLPFFPSPLRDDGYDISDYEGVHPSYGTLEDVQRLVAEAHARGIRIIAELVVNHTSDQHPWFQRARRAPRDSPERDFYVWSDDDRKFAGTRIIFTDTETSNWAWDPVAGQYFWHRFFSHQPDLNFQNHAVIGAIVDAMRFWCERRRGRLPARRRAVPVRARRHQQREPARDARRHQSAARGARRASSPTASSSPKRTSGPRICRRISATATSATCASTSR